MKLLLAYLMLGFTAAGITVAGSSESVRAGAVPVFALCALFAFAVQWLVFVHSYLRQTERFFDLTGSITYVSVMLLALSLSPQHNVRSLVIAACVIFWAVRLGTFLFLRILKDGGDSRFDRIKAQPLRLLLTWSLQGLWVLVTAGCALAAITGAGAAAPAVDWALLLGAAVWVAGFAIEVIADSQKRAWRRAEGSDAFISSGLWRYSRHPNYAGEILLWCGIAIMAFPALHGWQHVTLISPVFVYLLLTRISGVPMLEKKAEARWGDDPAYREYVERTPVLFPWSR